MIYDPRIIKRLSPYRKQLNKFAFELIGKGYVLWVFNDYYIVNYMVRTGKLITYYGLAFEPNRWWVGDNERIQHRFWYIDPNNPYECKITERDIIDSMRMKRPMDDVFIDMYKKIKKL